MGKPTNLAGPMGTHVRGNSRLREGHCNLSGAEELDKKGLLGFGM